MKVKIEKLTFNCIVGILPFEREKEQRVIIECSFHYTYKKSIFIDYAKVAQEIEKIMKKKKFKLLEDAIVDITEKLTTKYALKKLKLKIAKPDILNNCVVSLSN
ncbi:MAG: dihydroneopterin aldolase [Candidatus Marinarcus sp.]|uniref:dihydroneopterin aldolase n=1 Tax=Candidatus Marinarcus sp. TaxID=3100987 RepID=UPI003AFFB79C